MEYKISAHWDNEAQIWTATSDNIPGLCLESPSFDALVEKVKVAAPELLEMNNKVEKNSYFTVDFLVTRKDKVVVYG